MRSAGPVGIRLRRLGQFTQVLPSAPERNKCEAQGDLARVWVCARVCAGRGGCRGGCCRGFFVEGSCGFGSQPGASSLLVPRGHLPFLHSTYISPPSPLLPSVADHPAPRQPSGMASKSRGPRAGVGERSSADVAAGRGEVAEQEGTCWPCGGRWKQPRPQHCYLRQQLRRAAPRPAPPCPLAVPGAGAAVTLEEAAALRARSARRERGPGVSVSRAAEAEAIAALGHRELATPRIRGPGAEISQDSGLGSRASAAFEPPWEGWRGLNSFHIRRVTVAAALPGPQRTAICPLRRRRAGLDPRPQKELGRGLSVSRLDLGHLI